MKIGKCRLMSVYILIIQYTTFRFGLSTERMRVRMRIRIMMANPSVSHERVTL